MTTLWAGAALVVLGLHYCFVGYLVVGGFLAWRWPKSLPAHLAVVTWALVIVTTKVPCPLTALQNELREQSGAHRLSSSFVNLYVRGTFYPTGQQTVAQLTAAAVILASWVGFARRRTRHDARSYAGRP